MEVNFDFNKEDIWNYGKHVTFNMVRFKMRMIVNILMVPLLVIIVGTIKQFTLLEYLIYIIAFTALYIYVLSSVLKSKMIKANSGKGGPLGLHHVVIGEDGISEKLPERESHHNWSEIQKVTEDKKYIYILWNITSAHVIPKRAFSEPGEAIHFIGKVREYQSHSSGK